MQAAWNRSGVLGSRGSGGGAMRREWRGRGIYRALTAGTVCLQMGRR